MDELGDIQWLFAKTNGIPDMTTLKRNVLNSLKKANGNPIDELEKLFESQEFANKFRRVYGQDIVTADDLLRKIESSAISELH